MLTTDKLTAFSASTENAYHKLTAFSASTETIRLLRGRGEVRGVGVGGGGSMEGGKYGGGGGED